MPTYQSSSVQLAFDSQIIKDIMEIRSIRIPDYFLYTDPGDPTFGRVDDFHTSVLYGVPHVELQARVHACCQEVRPRVVVVGPLSYFETPDYDVLHLRLCGNQEQQFREALLHAFPEASDPFGDQWVPHVTLAYLKMGCGRDVVASQRGPHCLPTGPCDMAVTAPGTLAVPVRHVEVSRMDGVVEQLTPDGGFMGHR